MTPCKIRTVALALWLLAVALLLAATLACGTVERSTAIWNANETANAATWYRATPEPTATRTR